MRRGSICAVFATRSMIVDGKPARMRTFSVAAAASGVIIVPLHWLAPDSITLSASYVVDTTLVVAGASLGIGAWLNGACVLGSFSHLTGGQTGYLWSIASMVLGAVFMTVVGHDPEAVLRPSILEQPTVVSVVVVSFFAIVLALALYRRLPRWWRGFRSSESSIMGPYRSTLVVGVCGGVLYAVAGNWTYMSVLSNRAERLVDPTLLPSDWPALLVAVAVVVGGINAAWQAGDFVIQHPSITDIGYKVTGGFIMGAAAAMIPGGNGTLLIHGLPSLAPHAIAAYAAMVMALSCAFILQRLLGFRNRSNI